MVERNIKKFLRLVDKANKIVESDATWETKYDIIFSSEVKGRLQLDFKIEWDDPDCCEEDDIRAFMCAVNEKADDLRKVLEALEGERT